jgi:hypothetical protein
MTLRHLNNSCSCKLIAILICFSVGTLALGQEPAISLTGVIDFHAHAGPDSRPRALNDFEAVRQARQAGLRGIVLKNHFTMTADRAALAMTLVTDFEVFGGVALNRAVGGINPEAVRQMVAFDGGRGKVVWLPTFDAEFYVTRTGEPDPYVSIVVNGRPVPELLEVFELVSEHDLVLAMGHSSPEEVLLLIPIAKALGVEQILVTHVFGQGATRHQMERMAALGVVMELDWLAAYSGIVSIESYADVINAIGAEYFLISSDFGQAGNPDHATGMAAFILALRQADLTSSQIDQMARHNPARMLGLD